LWFCADVLGAYDLMPYNNSTMDAIRRVVSVCFLIVATFATTQLFVVPAHADRSTSPNFIIESTTGGNFGDKSSSTNYSLVSTGGEPIIGDGASGSYKLGAGYSASLERAMQITVQPSGLVGYYALDTGTGTVAIDDSANANHAALSGGAGWTAGKIGGATTFNGSTQYANLGNPANLQFTQGTVSVWVKTTDAISTKIAVSKENVFSLGIKADRATLYDWTTASYCTDTSFTVTDGAWHLLTMTLQNGVSNGTQLYVDGQLAKSCTLTAVNQTKPVYISATNDTQDFFSGSLDEIKLYNRHFSAPEVSAEYAAQLAGNAAGAGFGALIPGISKTALLDAAVQTDAGEYGLFISQDHNMQSGANSIAAISGSIASPITWAEGTTKGLGFTLTGASATAIAGSWNSGASYAALPASSTSFYTRTGVQVGGTKDTVSMRLRLDVPVAQPPGDYSNTVTVTGTMVP
jgi:hypothetical protein